MSRIAAWLLFCLTISNSMGCTMSDINFALNDENRTWALQRYIKMQANVMGVPEVVIYSVDLKMKEWGYDQRFFSRLIAKQDDNWVFDFSPRWGFDDRLILLVDSKGNLLKYGLKGSIQDESTQLYKESRDTIRINKSNVADYYLPGISKDMKGKIDSPFSESDHFHFQTDAYNGEDRNLYNYAKTGTPSAGEVSI